MYIWEVRVTACLKHIRTYLGISTTSILMYLQCSRIETNKNVADQYLHKYSNVDAIL